MPTSEHVKTKEPTRAEIDTGSPAMLVRAQSGDLLSLIDLGGCWLVINLKDGSESHVNEEASKVKGPRTEWGLFRMGPTQGPKKKKGRNSRKR